MKRILYSLFILLSYSTFSSCYGQVTAQEYVEFEIDDKLGEDYRLIPAGEEGVLAVLASTKPQKNAKRELIATFMNTNLHTIWSKKYLVDNNVEIIDHQYTKGNIYFLLEESTNKYQVIDITLETGEATYIKYEEVKNFYITDFSVIDSIIFFGGTIKSHPAIIRYNYQNQSSIVAPSINQLKADLVGMFVDEKNGVFSAVLRSQQMSDEHSIYIATYDLEGKMLNNFTLERNRDYNFLTFRPHVISENEMVVIGTYGLKYDDRTQGVYALKTKNGVLENLRFYDFGYFKNFFNFLPEKKKDRLERNIAKKRESGKKKRLRYNPFVHDLKVTDRQIIFAADIYDPIREAPNSPIAYSGYGIWRDPLYRSFSADFKGFDGEYIPAAITREPIPKNRPISYGFTLLNTVTCGFDFNGALMWDNSFSYDEEDIESDYPLELTNVYADTDSVVFVSAFEEGIRYKVSDLRGFSDSVTVDTLQLYQPFEKSINYENGGILDWYDSNFLVSGLRKIKNKENNEQSRDVFFMYKLHYPINERREERGR
ncbi:hypothetical protein [Chondrinema litorale]|uniref:hypothetical protein n=1 Tax=Chondrinema litorale TaxID=2994555 RepID=UPI0025430074|nr:hypothetical protein [Chondrinema litorale]UZR93292.1 hypothetical protein OQ292_15655 [Chondrinema litorale]